MTREDAEKLIAGLTEEEKIKLYGYLVGLTTEQSKQE